MRLLGIDWGARRIGLAIKPAGQDWALPRGVLYVADEGAAADALRGALAADTSVDGVVIGLPLHADPRQANAIRRSCRRARSGMRGIRWFFTDEALTTRAAESRALESGGGAADDLAAQIILETFIAQCR